MENDQKEQKQTPFYPDHVFRQLIQIFILVGVLVALATFLPAPMEPKADPFTTPSHIKPEWYFLAPYQFIKASEYLSFLGAWAPKLVGVLGQGLVIILLFLWPFIDRGEERRPWKRPRFLVSTIVAVLLLLFFTVWGYYS
jgi:ubiquinol-cytochrome c reductase cytochrome b subunit